MNRKQTTGLKSKLIINFIEYKWINIPIMRQRVSGQIKTGEST